VKKLIAALLILVWVGVSSADVPSPNSTSGPNISLNAVGSTGAGTATSFGGVLTPRHTWTVKTTGSPTAVTVNFEGSIDNVDWFTLDSSTATSSEMRHVVNKPVLFVRCNLTTLTGGTSPTVTCKFASGGMG